MNYFAAATYRHPAGRGPGLARWKVLLQINLTAFALRRSLSFNPQLNPHKVVCLRCCRGGISGAKRFYVAHGWQAEEAAVFTAELTDAFIADFIGGLDASMPSISMRCLAVCSRSCF